MAAWHHKEDQWLARSHRAENRPVWHPARKVRQTSPESGWSPHPDHPGSQWPRSQSWSSSWKLDRFSHRPSYFRWSFHLLPASELHTGCWYRSFQAYGQQVSATTPSSLLHLYSSLWSLQVSGSQSPPPEGRVPFLLCLLLFLFSSLYAFLISTYTPHSDQLIHNIPVENIICPVFPVIFILT